MISPPKKAKLIWNCRRGMLELDLILARFIPHLDLLTDAQVLAFEQLLSNIDPQLYNWLIGQEQPAKEVAEIVATIRHYNNAK